MMRGSPEPSRSMHKILPLLLLVACSGPNGNEPGLDKYGRTPETAAQYAAAVERRELKPGMHKSEIREVMRGDPTRISRKSIGNTKYTVWEYRDRSLDLYLDDDGFLMRWSGP